MKSVSAPSASALKLPTSRQRTKGRSLPLNDATITSKLEDFHRLTDTPTPIELKDKLDLYMISAGNGRTFTIRQSETMSCKLGPNLESDPLYSRLSKLEEAIAAAKLIDDVNSARRHLQKEIDFDIDRAIILLSELGQSGKAQEYRNRFEELRRSQRTYMS